MQDAAEAVGRSNDKRKVLVCVTWEKLVPSPFLILYCGSAVLDVILGSWRASTLGAHLAAAACRGGDGWESLLCCLLPLIPQRLFAAALWARGKVCTSRSPLGKALKGLFPMG